MRQSEKMRDQQGPRRPVPVGVGGRYRGSIIPATAAIGARGGPLTQKGGQEPLADRAARAMGLGIGAHGSTAHAMAPTGAARKECSPRNSTGNWRPQEVQLSLARR